MKRFFVYLAVAFFWIGLWWIFALAVNDSYALPSPVDTAKALLALFGKKYFYEVIAFSLFRVLVGLALGILVAVLLSYAAAQVSIVRTLVSPIISVMKAMPVATFILLLWLTVSGQMLTVFIGFIMVMPIIYQNLLEGYDAIDKNLRELTVVFGFSGFKRFRFLTLPTLLSYFSPAVVTSIGLAFKSQIAAEIIAYTNNSIGQYIYDANFALDTPSVFAWASVIVTFSISLEVICKKLLGRIRKVD